MKWRSIVALPLLVGLCLSGCSSAAPGSGVVSSSASDQTGAAELDLSTEMRLAVGTFELEGTDLAVDSEQAAALLPLWKAYRALAQSDTAAQAEITAVISHIRTTMTSEQLEAIDSMDLSQEAMSALFQELGITPMDSSSTENRPQISGGEPPAGAMPGGVPGEGPAGGGGLEQGLNPDQIATLQAERSSGAGTDRNGSGLILLDPLIELLQSKVG